MNFTDFGDIYDGLIARLNKTRSVNYGMRLSSPIWRETHRVMRYKNVVIHNSVFNTLSELLYNEV